MTEKDTDARWTTKHGMTFCGDTNHVTVDTETQLIDQWPMTAVSVHDRRMLESVLAVKPAGDSQLWVDSGYRSQELVKALRERGYKPRIVFKAQRGTKLNKAYSLSRARVE